MNPDESQEKTTSDETPSKHNFDESPTKVYRIVKYSLFLFSLAFFLFAGSRLLTDTIPTAGSTKKLPIYCVDTEEKKVALSFDAAWGNERYGKSGEGFVCSLHLN